MGLAWLSCDRADADPVGFWAGFIEARAGGRARPVAHRSRGRRGKQVHPAHPPAQRQHRSEYGADCPHGLDHLRNAAAVLGSKATAEELDEYRRFVLTLAGKVAAAHREHGQDVSPAEAEAIQQITALGTSSS